MKYCESCFAVGLDDDLFCPNCGQEYSSVHLGSDLEYSKELGIEMRSLLDPPKYDYVKRKVALLRDAKIKRTITREDRKDVSFNEFVDMYDHESTFADIADAYANTTTASNFEWKPVEPKAIKWNAKYAKEVSNPQKEKKRRLRQRLRTGVAWGLLFAIASLVVVLLNIQLTGTI